MTPNQGSPKEIKRKTKKKTSLTPPQKSGSKPRRTRSAGSPGFGADFSFEKDPIKSPNMVKELDRLEKQLDEGMDEGMMGFGGSVGQFALVCYQAKAVSLAKITEIHPAKQECLVHYWTAWSGCNNNVFRAGDKFQILTAPFEWFLYFCTSPPILLRRSRFCLSPPDLAKYVELSDEYVQRAVNSMRAKEKNIIRFGYPHLSS